MTKARFIPLMTVATGLNNVLDSVRLAYDPKTGETELAQAVNVNIDNSGRPSRRLGRTRKLADAARCGFADGDVCLFVSGAILYKMAVDYSIVALRTDLTPGLRMRYRRIADRVYYLNGKEKGYVAGGADHTWEKGSYTSPGDTRRTYSNPPNGHLVSWFGSRALVARENAVFASEPSFYGVFDLHNDAKLFPERVTMLQPTTAGLWVGTTARVMFYRGTQWEKLRREPAADFGVLEGSDVWCPGEKLKGPKAVLFTTPKGICSGTDEGAFTNLTYNKLTFPAGSYASATMAGDRYLVLIEP